MNKAILLPGLLSQQPYQNVRWSTIPLEWQKIYQQRFSVFLRHDYYSGNCFRAKVFRHIVYIYSYIESTKRLEYDYYAFSLSLLACSLNQNILSFESIIDIFIDLESKILESKDKYKMCIIPEAGASCINKICSLLKPCFIGNKIQIHHLLSTDESKFNELMQDLSIDYITTNIEFPFHSQSCPLHSNPIHQKNLKLNATLCPANVYSLNAVKIENAIKDVNNIFTEKISFSAKMRAYDCIFELASRAQLISLLKDSLTGIEDNTSFELLDN